MDGALRRQRQQEREPRPERHHRERHHQTEQREAPHRREKSAEQADRRGRALLGVSKHQEDREQEDAWGMHDATLLAASLRCQ